MFGYALHFIVYTLAMSGLIFFALFVYKKLMNGGLNSKGTRTLLIEEVMNINPRKSLIIVRAGKERFLLASDVDKTTLISKLDDNDSNEILQTERNLGHNVNEEIEKLYNKRQNIFPEGFEDKIIKAVKEPVHLEVITQKNPAAANLNRKNSYSSRSYIKSRRNSLEKEFSTIRDMAAKINKI